MCLLITEEALMTSADVDICIVDEIVDEIVLVPHRKKENNSVFADHLHPYVI